MEYKYKWYIPDAYLHSRGTGYFTSHEGCAFINETDRDAHVRFTFYFQDREPMTGYTSVVPARRTKHARFDLMENDKGTGRRLVRFFYACFLIEEGRADILIIRLR